MVNRSQILQSLPPLPPLSSIVRHVPIQAVHRLLAGRDVAVSLPFLGTRVVVVVVELGGLVGEGLGVGAGALGALWLAAGVVVAEVPGDGAALRGVAGRVAQVVQHADAEPPSLPLLLDL